MRSAFVDRSASMSRPRSCCCQACTRGRTGKPRLAAAHSTAEPPRVVIPIVEEDEALYEFSPHRPHRGGSMATNLPPTGEALGVALGVRPLDQCLEFRSWEPLEPLAEHAAEYAHGRTSCSRSVRTRAGLNTTAAHPLSAPCRGPI